MLILIIIASLILLYSTWLQRKLKDKNLQLSEQIKKVEWGLVLSKELIRDNSNQYIQLEKVLNRYATLVPQQLFEESARSTTPNKSTIPNICSFL